MTTEPTCENFYQISLCCDNELAGLLSELAVEVEKETGRPVQFQLIRAQCRTS